MSEYWKSNFDPADSLIFRGERPWPAPRLKRGAIVGHTTATTTKLWLRTAALGEFKLLVCPVADEEKRLPKPGLLSKMEENIKASAEEVSEACDGEKVHDFSVDGYSDDTTKVVELEELQPDTLYRYMLLKKESEDWIAVLGADKTGVVEKRKGLSFRTMKKDEDAQNANFSFAMFSCNNPFADDKSVDSRSARVAISNMDAWAAFAQTLRRYDKASHKERIAFVIGGGDQAYTDGRKGISIWNLLYKVMREKNGKLLPEQGTMLTWFRDIYRGYWGFADVREVFANYPTYMIWDDHEIGDGWGSFDDPKKGGLTHKIFEKAEDEGLSQDQAQELLSRMFAAAKEAYIEYEHSHNPGNDKEHLHYSFHHGPAAFFVLDGRGERDINRDSHRIHGEKQIKQFKAFVEELDESKTKFLFVVSAVPMLHAKDSIVGLEDDYLFNKVQRGNRDDLRDAWEHSSHDEERKEVKQILWDASKRGIKVAVLSGDVHASAVFRLEKEDATKTVPPIYQLTSSAITYHLGHVEKLAARFALPAKDSGKTDENETFSRLFLSIKSPFALIKVYPQKGKAIFQAYSNEKVEWKPGEESIRTNSLARIELW